MALDETMLQWVKNRNHKGAYQETALHHHDTPQPQHGGGAHPTPMSRLGARYLLKP